MQWVRYFAGSVAVYIIVASCAPDAGRLPQQGGRDASASGTANGVNGNRNGAMNGSAAAGAMGAGGESNDGAPGPGSNGTTNGTASGNERDGSFLADAMADVVDPVPMAMADAYESGSRLKARFLETPGGARSFLGWHDSELGIDCSFSEINGAHRCLPSPYRVVSYSIPYYSDASCTNRVVPDLGSPCPDPDYALRYETCGDGERSYFEIGAKVLGGSTYIKSGENCNASTAPVDYYPLGSEVPLSTFASASVID